jgi:hypothetical protein
MANKDLHNSIVCTPAFNPAAAVTNNTAYVTEILDTQGYEKNELAMHWGSIADADATFVVLLEDGDAADMSDNVAVVDAELIGTELLAAPLFSDDNSIDKIGYKGSKRYIRATITPSANTGNIFMSAMWIQSAARHAV